MKKKILLIVVALLGVGVIVGASLLYSSLSEDYERELPNIPPSESESESESESKQGSENTLESDIGGSASEESSAESEAETEVSQYLAPDFTVYDIDGNAVKLSDYFGKPIVLNFWTSWCYICDIEMPSFNSVAASDPEVQFLMVNATGVRGESVEDGEGYMQDKGYDLPVLYDIDADARMTYGVTSYPITFFIASNGDLYTYYAGALDEETLKEIIAMVKEYK